MVSRRCRLKGLLKTWAFLILGIALIITAVVCS